MWCPAGYLGGVLHEPVDADDDGEDEDQDGDEEARMTWDDHVWPSKKITRGNKKFIKKIIIYFNAKELQTREITVFAGYFMQKFLGNKQLSK